VGKSSLWVHNKCFEIGILKHFKYGKGLIQGEVNGAHNLVEFSKYLNHPTYGPLIRIKSRRQVIPGVEVIEYDVRAMLSGSKWPNLRPSNPPIWKPASNPKTVYDPAIHPDRRYLMWVYQAYQDAKAKNNFYGAGSRTWDGIAKNGVKFRGHLNNIGEVTTGYIP